MNKTRHKRQKYKYHSRKAFNHKKHAKIRKSAKNKQPTNLLFKTVKLYKKQKNKYLDKENSIPIRVKKQKGGFQVGDGDINAFESAQLTPDNIVTIMDILNTNDKPIAERHIRSLNEPPFNEELKKIIRRYYQEDPRNIPEGDKKVDFLKVLAQKLGVKKYINMTVAELDAAIKTRKDELNVNGDTSNDEAIANAMSDTPGADDDDDTTREKPKKEKDEKDERTASFEQQDKARRKFASEKQVLNRLQRDLKQHNVSTKIFKDPTKLETLFTYEINTFDDLVNKNNSTIRNIMEKMNLNSTEKEKLLNLIKEYKHKKSNKTNNVNDNVNNKKPRQKTGNVSKLLKEIDDYKTKLENIQLKMKEMKSKKGDHVCFDTTTPDIVKEAGKGKGKVEKGTTVRICIESKKNVKEWAKSVAKGKNDKVITGNTLDISAESV